MPERRICLVSDFEGTGSYGLAQKLRAEGWDVSLLDLSTSGQGLNGFYYQKLAGLYAATNDYVQMQALLAYHWLRSRNFDLILFHHSFAAAFYSCTARHFRLAFTETPIVILASETHNQKLEKAFLFLSGRHDYEIKFMEERSVALADDVLFEVDEIARDGLEQLIEVAKKTPPIPKAPVFISVCIATYNRADWLREALQSLMRQSYLDFEVVVMDDGSTDKAVTQLRDELAPLFKQRKWQWHARTNTGPATARNAAAKLAKGDHLLFMDDDNFAYPDELERFAQAAKQGYDILGCILGMHPESQLAFPPTAQLPDRSGDGTRPVGWTPIGGDLSAGVFINILGDTNGLFRREVFEALGGFPTGPDAVFEDFELLTRALIAGYRIDVIPEVLVLYRRTTESRSMQRDVFAGHMHSLQPVAELLPPEMRSILLPLRSEWYNRHSWRRKNAK